MSESLPLVLVVDDDPTVRVLMRSALKKAGFDVALAADGEAGLAAFEQRSPKMVMLDVELPDLNGHEICRRIRAQAGEALPIVMVTGRDDVEAVARAYESGATDFIAKPIHWALFGHRVQYLYRAARAMVELSRLHARTAAVLGAIPDMLLRLDRSGRVLEVHDAGGFADRAMVPAPGDVPFASCPAEACRRLSEGLATALVGAPPQDIAFSCVAADGNAYHYEARIARIDEREALCLVRDITERAQAAAALARSESKLEHAQTMARLGSWHIDLGDGTVEWSAQTYRIFGLPEGTPVDSAAFLGLLHEDDRPRADAMWERVLREARPFSWEYRIRCGERVVWVVEHGDVEIDALGRARGVNGTVQDITERKEAETRIARLAYTDSLTGLPNRVAFLERLDLEVRRAARDGRRLALLFMDLDGFKAVNDTLGHLTGDRLLKGAADRLRNVLRESDVVARPEQVRDGEQAQIARLGGDEFTALLLGVGETEDVLAAAQRVLAALRAPFRIDGRELTLSSSLGIAIYPDDGADAATLLKHADTAMYHAKEQGRDNCQFYSAALTERAVERMSLHHDLRLATEQGQFHLVYQPQVHVGDGRVVGVEALLRWQHPRRGLVAPGEFIGLAESTGLIVRIGHWVLNQACDAAASWLRRGRAVRIAVNLSPVQLRDPDLVANVREALARTGLPPVQLELEVTEGALMDDSAATRTALQGLNDLGVRLALDDFGTGYSSMGYLKRMPVDMLKIDRSFVKGLPDDRDSEAIVRAIVSMARSLGFEITAEGVETAEQAATLGRIGCDLLQGYHLGRPMPVAQIEQRLLGTEPAVAAAGHLPAAHAAERVEAVP